MLFPPLSANIAMMSFALRLLPLVAREGASNTILPRRRCLAPIYAMTVDVAADAASLPVEAAFDDAR